jgi:hypothetical protein
MKPFFIRDMLLLFKSPIFWIDADGGINANPTLLLDQQITNFDIAGNRSTRDSSRVHVGSIWFNYTDITMKFVNAWCNAIVKRGIDDAVFNAIWQQFSAQINFYELPPEYFVILSNPNSSIPPDSCIIHRLSNSLLKRDYKHKVETT